MSEQEHHENTFVPSLLASQQAVFAVAGWLNSKGFEVTVPALSVAPTRGEASAYSDKGDLTAAIGVEVKGLTLEFTCCDDYKYDDFLIMAVDKWRRLSPKPNRIVIVNAQLTHAGVVYASSAPTWLRKRIPTQDPGKRQDTYYLPKQQIQFVEFFPKHDQEENPGA